MAFARSAQRQIGGSLRKSHTVDCPNTTRASRRVVHVLHDPRVSRHVAGTQEGRIEMHSGTISTRVWTYLLIGSLSSVTACEQASDNQVVQIASALKTDRGSNTNGDRGPKVEDEDRQAQKELDQHRRLRLQPTLTCIEDLSGQQLLAHWGYRNDNNKPVRRKLGRQNGFAPAPSNRGQPTKFAPGTVTDAFTTAFAANTQLTWTLDGGQAVADMASKRCSQGAAGSAGTAGGGAAGSGGGNGSGDACKQCESVPHDGNTNCPDSIKQCSNLTGTSSPTSPKPGAPRSELCNGALACIHATGCGRTAVTDCLCGSGIDPNDCFTKMKFADLTGVCKNELAQAAESTDMFVLQTRVFDPTYASGAATMVVETCDQFFCSSECLTPKSPCAQCESVPHDGNTNCPDSIKQCSNLTGTSSPTSPKPGAPRSELCNGALACIHATGCGRTAVTDCLCGSGIDPNDCFTKMKFADLTGVCKNELAQAAESTDMFVLQTRVFDPTYASGAATMVVETCDQFFCLAECLTKPAR